jgi:nucleoid-associated protein YgaU
VIFKGSRYETTPIVEVTDATGKQVAAIGIRFTPLTPAGFVHTVTDSDRLDLLAYQYYRNPEKFWLIGDANDKIDPTDLIRKPGTPILIPPDRGSKV